MNLNKSDELSYLIDEYLKNESINTIDSELEELFEVVKEINDLDIEPSELKKREAYKSIIKEETVIMNNKNNKILKKVASIALVGLIGIASIQTGFAQNIYEKIINLGNVTVEESTMTDKEYDEKHLLEDYKKLERDIDKEKFVYIDDLEVAQEKLKFNLKLPSKLPEGYKFTNVRFYVNKIEDISGEHAAIIFEENNKDFFINQVLSTKDNSFITRGKDIEKITINGRDAVIDKNGNIDIEIDGVLLTLLTKGNISREEAIDIIKSIQ